MSYVRWSEESDVYVFPDVSGGITCCGCPLQSGGGLNVLTQDDMMVHLIDHLVAGHKVPLYVFERLYNELVARVEAERDAVVESVNSDDPLEP